ncbi:MAG: hypothetical protein ACK53Y_07995, partial [bacterium]
HLYPSVVRSRILPYNSLFLSDLVAWILIASPYSMKAPCSDKINKLYTKAVERHGTVKILTPMNQWTKY